MSEAPLAADLLTVCHEAARTFAQQKRYGLRGGFGPPASSSLAGSGGPTPSIPSSGAMHMRCCSIGLQTGMLMRSYQPPSTEDPHCRD